jgi:hypothetical protein
MALSHGPRPITDGLVVSLDAANPKSYPGAGSTWYDISGNGNNATLNSAAFNVTGNYFENSGATSNFFHLIISNSTTLQNAFESRYGGWTIEETIWTNSVTYPEADAGTVVSSNAYGVGATGFDWNHGIGLTGFRFGMGVGNSATYSVTNDITIPSPYDRANIWRVRCMVWDRYLNQNRLYIDGNLIGSGSSIAVQGLSVYDGGGMSIGTLYGWKHYGRRATFKVYNRVLTSTEIKQNYRALGRRFVQ